jgi:hypothetical protein
MSTTQSTDDSLDGSDQVPVTKVVRKRAAPAPKKKPVVVPVKKVEDSEEELVAVKEKKNSDSNESDEAPKKKRKRVVVTKKEISERLTLTEDSLLKVSTELQEMKKRFEDANNSARLLSERLSIASGKAATLEDLNNQYKKILENNNKSR